ncbi:MAG: hypothetical protein ACYCQJ_14530 [Nitrososphaerales archaeon]
MAWSPTNLRPLQHGLAKIFTSLELFDPKDKTLLAAFLGKAALEIFANAFTDKFTDQHNSYEFIEFLGDKLLNGATIVYLKRRFNRMIPQHAGTQYLNKLMARGVQSMLTDQMGLMSLLRYNPGMYPTEDDMIKLKGDLFESFAGAIWNVAELNLGENRGYEYLHLFLKRLLDPMEIEEPEELRRDAWQELKETLNKLGWGNPVYFDENSDNPSLGAMKTTIRDPRHGILAVGYGRKQEARARAAQMALDQLAQQGITPESVERERRQITQTYAPRIQEAKARVGTMIPNRDIQAYRVNTESTGNQFRSTANILINGKWQIILTETAPIALASQLAAYESLIAWLERR